MLCACVGYRGRGGPRGREELDRVTKNTKMAIVNFIFVFGTGIPLLAVLVFRLVNSKSTRPQPASQPARLADTSDESD